MKMITEQTQREKQKEATEGVCVRETELKGKGFAK